MNAARVASSGPPFGRTAELDHDAVAVVDFVLDDLGGVVREVFDAVDEVLVQILNLNAAIAGTWTLAD